MLRGLIEAIVLTPQDGQLRIELRGNLAAMLAAAQKTKRSPETGDLFVPIQLVAAARNHLDLEFAWAVALCGLPPLSEATPVVEVAAAG